MVEWGTLYLMFRPTHPRGKCYDASDSIIYILTVAILGPCSTTSITRPNQLRTNINHGGSCWLSYFSDPALHSRGAVS